MNGMTTDDLVDAADEAMYKVKAGGKNDFEFYSLFEK